MTLHTQGTGRRARNTSHHIPAKHRSLHRRLFRSSSAPLPSEVAAAAAADWVGAAAMAVAFLVEVEFSEATAADAVAADAGPSHHSL